MEIPVLDHGYVRLIDSMGGDLSIVRAARVSHKADWRAGADAGRDERLIQYLAAHEHMTPFEAVVITLEIKCPLAIARQFHRHRTQSINEVSARYAEVDREYYCPSPEMIGTSGGPNKQVRLLGEPDPRSAEVIRAACDAAFDRYKFLLAEGCSREIARLVLPLATYTRYFTTMNLRNLAHFIKLRTEEGAQWEAQEYGNAMLAIAREVAPLAVEALLPSSRR